MISKQISARAAIERIRPRDTLCISGFVGTGTPEELIKALESRFLHGNSPFGLTLVFAAAPGDGGSQGVNRLAHAGLLKRVIGGHWALVPKLGALALGNEIEAYNLPLGVMSALYREIAAKRGGVLTKVGLGTFVDPRQGGGKLNRSTWQDLVKLLTIAGEEWLLYQPFPIDVAFIRATTADTRGNLTMENEALTLDSLAIATATKNSGGLVIAQVERVVAAHTLNPRAVEVPGILVDHFVHALPENHRQTWATQFEPAFAGQCRLNLAKAPPMALDERKLVARRAAFELPLGGVINLGIGMPEGVSRVASEEGLLSAVTLTAEPGVIGGMPQGGLDFGAAVNNDALLNQNQQFDFYDGGGLDLAVLGMAEVDVCGHVNVSKFGTRLAGAGGFINISQAARALVFVGTFTTGGLAVAVEQGELRIVREGRNSKFVAAVEQITFNGDIAAAKGQRVLYVTERAVFALGPSGLELVEVAPGIDVDTQVLALIPFPVKVGSPRLMDARIFGVAPIGLAKALGAEVVEGQVIAPEDELERRRNARKQGRLADGDDAEAAVAAGE